MIGKIRGRVDYTAKDYVLIDVNGVGYLVYCADYTLARLPNTGGMVALYTDLIVREDNLQLFGFLTVAELQWHKLLMTVQGVGAKAALAIVSALGVEGVGRALTLGDSTALKSASGVGPKLAQRIATELKDKAPALMARAMPEPSDMPVPADNPANNSDDVLVEESAPAPKQDLGNSLSQIKADSMSALVNLGYSQGDAAQAIMMALDSTDSTTDTDIKTAQDLIKLTLKILSSKND